MKNELTLIVALLIFINLRLTNFLSRSVMYVFDSLFISFVLFLSFKIYGFGTISYLIFVLTLILVLIHLLQTKEETVFIYLLLFLIFLGLSTLLEIFQLATFFGSLFFVGLFLLFVRGVFYEKN